ncbi:MAG: hypothetical protein IJ544_06760 [Prevotella sp.]|nr:hypothetical protein [Prevotella sp.]
MKKIIGVFPLCGGCSRRERREGLKNGEFYCAIAETILSKATVTNDMDGTKCVKNGWYNPLKL